MLQLAWPFLSASHSRIRPAWHGHFGVLGGDEDGAFEPGAECVGAGTSWAPKTAVDAVRRLSSRPLRRAWSLWLLVVSPSSWSSTEGSVLWATRDRCQVRRR